LSILGWSRLTPDPGSDPTHRTASFRKESGGEAPSNPESRKAEALTRIWNGFNERDPSGERSESGTGSVAHPWADHARSIRLLVEQVRKDTQASTALRADLAASLRSVTAAYFPQPLSDPDPNGAREQQLFWACRYAWARQQASHAVRTEMAVRRLRTKQLDLSSKLQDAATLLRQLQLSHLKAALVFSVRDPDGPVCSDTIEVYTQIADSLGEIADLLESIGGLSEPDKTPRGRVEIARELSERMRTATHKLSRSTANSVTTYRVLLKTA